MWCGRGWYARLRYCRGDLVDSGAADGDVVDVHTADGDTYDGKIVDVDLVGCDLVDGDIVGGVAWWMLTCQIVVWWIPPEKDCNPTKKVQRQQQQWSQPRLLFLWSRVDTQPRAFQQVALCAQLPLGVRQEQAFLTVPSQL